MFGREPALWMGAVGAVIALGIGFGLPVTPVQFGLIMAAVAAILVMTLYRLNTCASCLPALLGVIRLITLRSIAKPLSWRNLIRLRFRGRGS